MPRCALNQSRKPHLPVESRRRRRFEMDVLLSNRPGDDLHRPGAVVAPGPSPDLGHAAAPGGKQRGMPCEQPFGRERLVIVARGVEHHFDDALDVAVRGLEGADVHAEPPRNRGADLFGVELFAFDFAALQHVGGQGFEDGFLAEVESEALPYGRSAGPADGGRRREVRRAAPCSSGNRGQSWKLVDIHSPHLHAEIIAWNHRGMQEAATFGILRRRPSIPHPCP